MSDRCTREVPRDFLNAWDPISINPSLKDDHLPLDEYDHFVPSLLAALRRSPRERHVAGALKLLLEDFGLSASASEIDAPATQLS